MDSEYYHRMNKEEQEYKHYNKSKKMESREIKKSQLAQYKGLGWTNEEMATKFNVTQGEIKKGLLTFGMVKERNKAEKVDSYAVVYTDDVL